MVKIRVTLIIINVQRASTPSFIFFFVLTPEFCLWTSANCRFCLNCVVMGIQIYWRYRSREFYIYLYDFLFAYLLVNDSSALFVCLFVWSFVNLLSRSSVREKILCLRTVRERSRTVLFRKLNFNDPNFTILLIIHFHLWSEELNSVPTRSSKFVLCADLLPTLARFTLKRRFWQDVICYDTSEDCACLYITLIRKKAEYMWSFYIAATSIQHFRAISYFALQLPESQVKLMASLFNTMLYF